MVVDLCNIKNRLMKDTTKMVKCQGNIERIQRNTTVLRICGLVLK